MVWNLFYILFLLLAIAAVALAVRFVLKKKWVLLLLPALMLGGTVAFVSCYYTMNNMYTSPSVVNTSSFPSSVSADYVKANFQKTGEHTYTMTSEYDAGTVVYTMHLVDAQTAGSDFTEMQPTIDAEAFSRSDLKGVFSLKYTDVYAQRTTGALALRTGKYQQEFLVKAPGYICDIVLTCGDADTSDLIGIVKQETASFKGV